MVFPLKKGPGPIVLFDDSFRHPEESLRGGERLTRYADITHLVLTRRGLRVGTKRTVYNFDAAIFSDPAAVERLEAALILRIGAQPGGSEQLAAIHALTQQAIRPGFPQVCAALTLFCVAIFVLHHFEPMTWEAGFFGKDPFIAGEWWRIVTGNLLHANFIHLLFNGLGLLSIGALVEWPLGRARTLTVLLVSGVVAMGIGVVANYEEAVGASGIVAGLVGAIVWLEFRCPQDLPAWWRIPRRLLLTLLFVEVAISLLVPNIAAAAHIAGFVAGALITALLVPHSLTRSRTQLAGTALLNLVLFAGVLAALLTAGTYFMQHRDRVYGLKAERLVKLLDTKDPSELHWTMAGELNEIAWLTATEGKPAAADLEAALRLAEKAVELTERTQPQVLDTLAEVLFQLGRVEEALAVIQEAILLDPGQSYYTEQRRRFLGERARDDRPEYDAAPKAPPADEGEPREDEPGAPDAPSDGAPDSDGTMV